ncbi:hypothetical protein LMB24_00090 [Limosilactobacillus reuteri]|uniref:hypothetical protein n=1 Tax=Limosilactobacillus reuteri TaxID=1598 RepID=UPI001E591952|nr:hypothetical protein [Limosilactobacillus reuteri]MCC4351151.1 hypothetical protein [Limosilactobacillus reuteri]MCC4359484.1 hypothetical protein [Limosilactobacillus reuteri]MCC4379841.1 hypothetical protein [Limosilactobacillus reuteri]MCC4408131.1 hypothetical protein [Limosilactobacillus reuteri]MCC4414888.1 hypothetical protein [Limosilactobacillus reuteri]
MITPEKFKQWYKNADLELIAGSHNQEINLDTNLWQGFEVYLHWYKNKNYWDIKRNRFNSKCEVYKIQKRFFSKKYSLLLTNSEILSELDSTDPALIDLRLQKPFINLMGIQLTGLVEYMNSVTLVRARCLHSLGNCIDSMNVTRRSGVVGKTTLGRLGRLQTQINNLNNLLEEIDGKGLKVPVEFSLEYFTDRYIKIMSN